MSVRARTGLVFVLLAMAVGFMLLSDGATTRAIGVLALFGFVVAGAFAIADHDFLDPDSESANDEAATAGTRRAQKG